MGSRFVFLPPKSSSPQPEKPYEPTEAEVVATIQGQHRDMYFEKDAPASRSKTIFDFYKKRLIEAKKKEQEKLQGDLERTGKALDLVRTLQDDPAKAHLLPPTDASPSELQKWYEEMSKPQGRPNYGNPPDIPEPTLDQLLATMHVTDRQFIESKDAPWAQREAIIDFHRRQWKEAHKPKPSTESNTAEKLEALHRLLPKPKPEPTIGEILNLKQPEDRSNPATEPKQPVLPKVPEEPKDIPVPTSETRPKPPERPKATPLREMREKLGLKDGKPRDLQAEAHTAAVLRKEKAEQQRELAQRRADKEKHRKLQELENSVDNALKPRSEGAGFLSRHPVPRWLKRLAGWAFVGASIAMAGLGEYAVALGLLAFAFVAFAIQIYEWSGHGNRLWIVRGLRTLWFVGVVAMLIFFAAIFYRQGKDKEWTNLWNPTQSKPTSSTSDPTAVGGFIQVFDRQLIPPGEAAAWAFVNVQYRTKGDKTVIGVVHRHLIFESPRVLTKDEVEKAIAPLREIKYEAENEIYELQPDSPIQLFSNPGEANDTAKRLTEILPSIRSGKTKLYEIVVFKYRYKGMPEGSVRLTENCGWFSGTERDAWHNCWNRVYDAPK